MPVRGPFVRFLGGIALVCLAAVAVVGGVALRGPGMVAVLVSGAMAGCIAAGVARETPPPRRRSVAESALQAAAVTVAVLLVLSGTALLAGSGLAVLLLGTAGLGWGATRWLRGRRTEAATSALAFGPPVDPGLPTEAPAAYRLPISALSDEWVRTGLALRGSLAPAMRQGLVARRSQLLDELERRDPDGFARWLAAGPLDSADPTGFVRGEPRRAAPGAETEAA